MRFKKCDAQISDAVAVETTKKIKAICRGVGMSAEDADKLAELQGPRCRK